MSEPYPPEPLRATKASIQAAAEEIGKQKEIRALYQRGDPLHSLIEALGGKISYTPPSNEGREESIIVEKKRKFTVYISPLTTIQRDRFTIAHELGHYWLHYPALCKKHKAEVPMVAYRYISPNATEEEKRVEWEANWFAAAFLMPGAEFQEEWKKSSANLSNLARFFNVSVKAAEIRATDLKLPTRNPLSL